MASKPARGMAQQTDQDENNSKKSIDWSGGMCLSTFNRINLNSPFKDLEQMFEQAFSLNNDENREDDPQQLINTEAPQKIHPFRRAIRKSKPHRTRSAKAGLAFPALRIHRKFQDFKRDFKKIRVAASLYATAVLEYLTAGRYWITGPMNMICPLLNNVFFLLLLLLPSAHRSPRTERKRCQGT